MVKAYIMANCEIGSELHIIDELKTVPYVKEAHHVVGIYNVVAELELPSLEELHKIIVSKIRKMDMIMTTLTLVGIDGKDYSTY